MTLKEFIFGYLGTKKNRQYFHAVRDRRKRRRQIAHESRRRNRA